MPGFIFATGIENSAPLIAGPDGKDLCRDEMTLCGHDKRFAEDFALAKEVGVSHLRYGVPWYRVHVGPGRYDWEFSDAAFGALRETGLIPIVDLCHFCTPDWIGGFQDPSFPHHLAEYAAAFARRYPWLRLFTPVNEMYVAARSSAQFGWWNERRTDERSYVTALKHLAEADIRAARAISAVRGDAIFVQSESSEYYSPDSPGALALLAETLITGHEGFFFEHFIKFHATQKDVFTPELLGMYARSYAKPASLHAAFEYYRALNETARRDVALFGTKLSMPVMIVTGGGHGGFGPFEANQMMGYANSVESHILPGCGHWLPEECPGPLNQLVAEFLNRK